MNKLVEIQNKLDVPKTHYNEFGNYYYRNCEDILTALKPLLYQHELMLIINDDLVEFNGSVYIKATVTLLDSESKKICETVSYAKEPKQPKAKMDDSQTTGSASTYARKYALNAMFMIDDVKDADSQKPAEKKPSPSKPAQQNKDDDKPWLNEGTEEWTKAVNYLQSMNGKVSELFKKYKINKKNQSILKGLQK